jgi:hypothetical protein
LPRYERMGRLARLCYHAAVRFDGVLLQFLGLAGLGSSATMFTSGTGPRPKSANS